MTRSPAAIMILLLSAWQAAHALSVRDADYEGRTHFVVKTVSAEYWLDKKAGGFSRIVDPDGRDWISFRKEPLAKFPESAGAGYRGIPNAVFGKDNPDAGVGHPGFDQCESTLVSTNDVRTESKSGRWAWTWTFSESAARLRFEKVAAERTYWFLYEGTPGGRFSPANQFWGTDLGGPNFEAPTIKSQHFGKWRWAYFGDRTVTRVLGVAHVQPDELDDTFWYMGSTNAGEVNSPDGMVVFGFGRGAGTKALLRERQEFVVCLIATGGPAAAQSKVAEAMAEHLVPVQPSATSKP